MNFGSDKERVTKFVVGKYYKTRDGHKAQIICTDRKLFSCYGDYPVVAAVLVEDHVAISYTATGHLYHGIESSDDLISEWIDEPVLVPHYPALLHDSGKYYISWQLYATLGDVSNAIRLLTEYPPVMLPTGVKNA